MELTFTMLRMTHIALLVVLMLAACKPASQDHPCKEPNFLCQLHEYYLCTEPDKKHVVARFTSNLGAFSIDLLPDLAPATTENFIAYLEADFYSHTIVHKTNPEFAVQMGLYDTDFDLQESIRPPIKFEYQDAIGHYRGTVAMVRYQHPDSATSEFLINIQDNPLLNINNGYTVFGMIVDGMEVIDAMASRGFDPQAPIIIHQADLEYRICDYGNHD